MKALLVIPPIMDFAAHDMWAAPYGLMVVASAFKRYNIEFDILDLLGKDYVRKEYDDGRRRYKRTITEMPEPLKGCSIKRLFAIYGADIQDIEKEMEGLRSNYDIILITTTMTYWYYGYRLIYQMLRKRFPDSLIIAGGVYVTLLRDHSSIILDNAVLIPNDRLHSFDRVVSERLNRDFSCFNRSFSDWEMPDVISFSYRRYIPVLLIRGCPFRCTYCASQRLAGVVERKDPLKLADWVIEISEKSGIENVAFLDDAFLYRSDEIAKPFLKRLIASKKVLRLHAANGLHPRFIDEEMAYLMKDSGFVTIRLSLESSNERTLRDTGGKVKRSEYLKALRFLQNVGYKKGDLGTYLICGIPGQTPQEVIDSIRFVDDFGAVAYLAEFSPIPGTTLFESATKISKYDLNEPLWQNNTLMAYWNPLFNEDILNKIKAEIIRIRKEPTTGFEPVTY